MLLPKYICSANNNQYLFGGDTCYPMNGMVQPHSYSHTSV